MAKPKYRVFRAKDCAQDELQTLFLRSRVITKPEHGQILSNGDNQRLRIVVRNQTLYNLGVLLVELAYDVPLQDLQIAHDDEGTRSPHAGPLEG